MSFLYFCSLFSRYVICESGLSEWFKLMPRYLYCWTYLIPLTSLTLIFWLSSPALAVSFIIPHFYLFKIMLLRLHQFSTSSIDSFKFFILCTRIAKSSANKYPLYFLLISVLKSSMNVLNSFGERTPPYGTPFKILP